MNRTANVNTTVASDRWLEFPFLKRTIQDYADSAARHGCPQSVVRARTRHSNSASSVRVGCVGSVLRPVL